MPALVLRAGLLNFNPPPLKLRTRNSIMSLHISPKNIEFRELFENLFSTCVCNLLRSFSWNRFTALCYFMTSSNLDNATNCINDNCKLKIVETKSRGTPNRRGKILVLIQFELKLLKVPAKINKTSTKESFNWVGN